MFVLISRVRREDEKGGNARGYKSSCRRWRKTGAFLCSTNSSLLNISLTHIFGLQKFNNNYNLKKTPLFPFLITESFSKFPFPSLWSLLVPLILLFLFLVGAGHLAPAASTTRAEAWTLGPSPAPAPCPGPCTWWGKVEQAADSLVKLILFWYLSVILILILLILIAIVSDQQYLEAMFSIL